MAATKTAEPEVATPTPILAQGQVERFTPDPDQQTWIDLEKQRTQASVDAPSSVWQRAADAGLMFFNSPQTNDQWIGVAPLKQDDYPGVDLATIRKVPLNTSEVLQAGRKVKLPSGDTMVLPAGITSPDQIVHPGTGEKLLADDKKSKK